MPLSPRPPIRFRHPPWAVAFGAVIGLASGGLAGCSSPSRGPEVDVVEVERIEFLPTETATPASDSDDATKAPAEDVPSAPAAE